MFLQLSLSDAEGQIIDPIAVEIKSFAIYGCDCAGGMFVDVLHRDGEKERVRLSSEQKPFSPMDLGGQETHGISIVAYPSGSILPKNKWRERVEPFKVF